MRSTFTPATRIASIFRIIYFIHFNWCSICGKRSNSYHARYHTQRGYHIHRAHGISPAEGAELEVAADSRRQSKQTAVVIMVRLVDIVTQLSNEQNRPP